MKKIILTGGGTAGHVTPNLALIPALKEADYEIRYIGSYQGIERRLIENAGIPYDGTRKLHISAGTGPLCYDNILSLPVGSELQEPAGVQRDDV